jgi:general stress protein 26
MIHNSQAATDTESGPVVDRVWDIIEKARVCMMAMPFADGLRVRPMEALPQRNENTIYFLTDRRGLREDEAEVSPEVYLTFVYPDEHIYLALTGEAFVSRDPHCARALWDRQHDGWLSGPDDPNLMVMRVELWCAEMWGGPVNRAAADFQFAKARLFGTRANLGDSHKLTLELF